MKDLKYYEELFRNLHTNMQRGKPAPHKAFLLLSIIDLIEEGKIFDTKIMLTEELEDQFNRLWKKLLGKSPMFSPDIFKPYYHMGYEPFWKLVHVEECVQQMAADGSALMPASDDKEKPRYTRKWMQEHYRYAVIDRELFDLLQDANVRAQLRLLLIETYLVGQPIDLKLPVAAKLSSMMLFALLGLCVA